MSNKNVEIQNFLSKNTLYTNYKAEVFASVMVEKGIEKDKIRIIRKGKALRGAYKEVDSITYEDTENDTYYAIHTHRRDLYDSLPKGLFHSNVTNFSNKKQLKDRILKSIEIGRQEEKNARFFFKPFEFHIDRMFITTQLYERRLEKPHLHSDFINLFVHDWEFLKEIPLEKALFVLNFLSQSYRITSGEQIAHILSFFLECDVTLENTIKTQNISTSYQWKLGTEPLGETSFIGGSFASTYPSVSVCISGLPSKYKELIYPESSIRKQFRSLLDLFIPADAQLDLQIRGNEQETTFSLASEQGGNSILGFSTRLQ
ncbi:hypothetical protein CAPN001_14980 [Capnocytophaga stomatis]|uniref:Type VI secretion protein n=1 Tax=Capnocytophaga stomatis TaxID=1848904 RepID=A0A250G259_9FLAO|nr:type VI secretion system baseplate subunit TssG [Capnocytophaga stomatis]ATA90326.1 hypothetical protein CGC58_11645 [Capnocytophaga stomatis]GIJ94215.1 hypothetical protein CAPN002_14330 [Capnocytophaga stomatis]GIJ96929.1 hypothetical protein CAPN001_14980 [Capnocytophaga stomatis]GIM50599.1 hypothetical protein CAPN003_20510 [Capnocytophaga stomatis]